MTNCINDASKKAALSFVLAVFVNSPVVAWAQASSVSADDAAASDGSSMLKKSVQLGGNYTNNFFYSSNPDRNVFGLVLAPELSYAYILPRVRFFALGSMEAAGFDLPGNRDDYLDGRAKLGLEWQSAARHRFTYDANAQFSHDPFGVDRTAGSSVQDSAVDRWRNLSSNIQYYYGLPEDMFNIEATGNAGHKQYTTNDSVTRFLDYSKVLGDVTFLYNYSPKTALLFNVTGVRTSFDQPASSSLDSTELHYLAGVRWTATAKTSADARVGFVNRRPSDSRRNTFSTIDWRANIRWLPESYRSFTLQTGRQSQESYLSGVSFIDNRLVSLDWVEELSPLITTKAGVNYVQSHFVDSGRIDKNFTGTVGADYKVSEYTTILGNVGYGTRDSNSANLNYNRISSYLGVKFSR